MRIFARVAAVQNLSAVGSELGLTPGTISKRIQALEDELSARLFDRTTRSIRIHRGGRDVPRPRRAHPVRDRGGPRQCRRQGQQAKGKLKISAPAVLGAATSPRRCASSCATTPRSRRRRPARPPVNLQEDGYDVAIRTGTLSDSSLIAKRLAPDRHVVAASPAYLATGGHCAPSLAKHNCLVLGGGSQWLFSRNGAETTVRVAARSGPITASCSVTPRLTASALFAHPSSKFCRAHDRASWCRCCPTSRLAPMPRCGRSIRAPSTCCRACACCSISWPTGSAMRRERTACRRRRHHRRPAASASPCSRQGAA